jgi:hypothetical protein
VPIRHNLSPIARTYIIVRGGIESAGGCQEPIDCLNVSVFILPTENKRLIIRVTGATASNSDSGIGTRPALPADSH